MLVWQQERACVAPLIAHGLLMARTKFAILQGISPWKSGNGFVSLHARPGQVSLKRGTSWAGQTLGNIQPRFLFCLFIYLWNYCYVMGGHPSPLAFVEQTIHVCIVLSKHHKVSLLLLRFPSRDFSIRRQSHIPSPLIAALLQLNFGNCHETHISYCQHFISNTSFFTLYKIFFFVDEMIFFSVMVVFYMEQTLPCLYITRK